MDSHGYGRGHWVLGIVRHISRISHGSLARNPGQRVAKLSRDDRVWLSTATVNSSRTSTLPHIWPPSSDLGLIILGIIRPLIRVMPEQLEISGVGVLTWAFLVLFYPERWWCCLNNPS